MSDDFLEQLTSYIDNDLTEAERRVVEARIQDDPSVAATYAQLRDVVRRAQALDDRAPATDLWPGIAKRIGVRNPQWSTPIWKRRFAFSVPQLMAAAIIGLLLSTGLTYAVVRQGELGINNVLDPAFGTFASLETYDAAIANLAAELKAKQSTLDPETVRIVMENLAEIDQAIQDARVALAADPESEFLQRHLERTSMQKLALLRDVTSGVGSI